MLLLSIPCLVLLFWAGDRILFPNSQVHWFNYILVKKGMSKETVTWLLAPEPMNGLTLAKVPRIADVNSTNGFRPVVTGDTVMLFKNAPPDGSFIFVGLSNGRVVDTYYGPIPRDDN